MADIDYQVTELNQTHPKAYLATSYLTPLVKGN